MPLIYMVRHGRIADPPADERDPELGPQGRDQAESVAQELVRRIIGPLPILTSPLLRCRETAAPLARLWSLEPVVEPRVVEVPSPDSPLLPRQAWLKLALAATWAEAAAHGEAVQPGYHGILHGWRRGVREAVLACAADTVIFTHYVPINAMAGEVLGHERMICFRPANASLSVFETAGGTIRLVELGREADGRVA
ncbi:MAG: histidine phosphatase family protein [Nevskia sp.]|nr:histidine phosphatase family protein [Nevskia sp.]